MAGVRGEIVMIRESGINSVSRLACLKKSRGKMSKIYPGRKQAGMVDYEPVEAVALGGDRGYPNGAARLLWPQQGVLRTSRRRSKPGGTRVYPFRVRAVRALPLISATSRRTRGSQHARDGHRLHLLFAIADPWAVKESVETSG